MIKKWSYTWNLKTKKNGAVTSKSPTDFTVQTTRNALWWVKEACAFENEEN